MAETNNTRQHDAIGSSGPQNALPSIGPGNRPFDSIEQERTEKTPELHAELDVVRKSQGKEQTGRMITVDYRHSLASRWMHWINFPLLFLMIYSGTLIYWADSQHEGLHAHQVYRIGIANWTLFRFFPRWFYSSMHLKFHLAQGLAYHFFFMWLFALNGLAYVIYTIVSGEWRNLVPTRHSARGVFHVVLHDLGLRKQALPKQKFNDAQRIAYTGVVLMGAGSLLTGLAIYKPTQLHVLTTLLGGYEMARWFHFWLTLSYVAFFLIHIMQVIRAGWNNLCAMIIGYQVVPAALTCKEALDEQSDFGS